MNTKRFLSLKSLIWKFFKVWNSGINFFLRRSSRWWIIDSSSSVSSFRAGVPLPAVSFFQPLLNLFIFYFFFSCVITFLQLSVSWDPTFLIGRIEVSQKARIIWVYIFWLRFDISKSINKTPKKLYIVFSSSNVSSFSFSFFFPHTFYN